MNTLEEQIANGAYLSPERQDQGSGVFAESWLGVPIIAGDRVLGVVGLGDYKPHAYNDNHINLLQTLSSNMGVAIENARLFQAEQQRIAELAIINSVQASLAAELNIQGIYDAVGDKIREIFHNADVGIRIYDPLTDMEMFPYAYENGERITGDTIPVSGRGFSGYVYRTHETVVINENMEQAMEKYGSYLMPGTQAEKSAVFVPLLAGDQVRGLINLVDMKKEHAFSESDVRLLQTLANSMSVALENARLFDETQRLLKETEQRAAELAILNSVSAAMAKTLDVETTTRVVGDKVTEIFNADHAMILLLDLQTNLIHTLYEFDKEDGLIELAQPFPLGKGLTSKVILSRQPLMLGTREELITNGIYIAPELTEQRSENLSQSWLGVPIVATDRVLGVVALSNYRPQAFSENHMRLLQTLASNMGVAIENGRLFDETQRLLKVTEQRAAELAILNSVSEGLVRELDYESIIELVGEEIRRVFEVDQMYIGMYDRTTNTIVTPYYIEHGDRFPVEPMQLGGGFAGWVLANRKPLFINENLEAWIIENLSQQILIGDLDEPDLTRSIAAAPIWSSNQVIGLITLYADEENAFLESRANLLTTLAANLGVALENARLFDETERLLKESEQRAAELSIINSVQAALAAELNIQGIYEAVGDKIREIFHQVDMGIRIYDPNNRSAPLPIFVRKWEADSRSNLSRSVKKELPDTCCVPERRWCSTKTWRKRTAKYGSFTLPGSQLEKSSVYVPLVVGDQARGLINLIDMDREHAFSDSDVRLLQTLANSMSVALENARLFDETQRLLKETEKRSSELATLNSISEAMARTLDVKTLPCLVGRKMHEIFEADSVIIMLLDPETNLIQIPYEYDCKEGGEIATEVEPFPLGTGLSSKVILSRRPLLLNSLEEQIANGAYFPPELLERSAEGALSQSWLGVPIAAGDRVLGLVALADYKPNMFNNNHLNLLQTLSSNLGVSIENARLFQAEQQRVEELAIINSVQAALASELNIQGIYDTVGDKIREIFHNTDLSIRIYDHQARLETFPYMVESGQRIQIEPDPMIERGISAHVIRTHETVVINENLEKVSESYGSYTIPGTQSEKSAVFVPLLVGDQVRGLINLSDMEREHAYSDSDVRLLQTLANSMSVALENARLFDETQRLLKETEQRNAELAIINSVQAALAAELNIQGIYEAVGDKIREIFHNADVGIRIFDPKAKQMHFPYAYENGEPTKIDPMPLSGFSAHIFQTRETLVFNENMAEALEKYGSNIIPGTKFDKSAVFVPLLVGDQVRGLIEINDYEHEHAFSNSDVRLAANAREQHERGA